jgi:GNAT superfamily N-acetyltransferase
MAIVFREARAEDLRGVMRLLRQMHPADPPLDGRVESEIYEAMLHRPGLHLFVLDDDGSVVATTYLNVVPNLTRGASPYAVIENVVVDEARRGQGLGKRLMAETLRAAWAAGCYKAMLQTGSKDVSTHAFYERCGFSGTAKTAYVARPD